MIIDVGADQAEVRDADDCGRFHVESTLGPVELDRALQAASAGHGGEDGAAWVSIDWVRSAVGAAPRQSVGGDWPERFAAMVDYARSKGWLDGPGTHVRAHVVRAPAAGSS
jgi:hypothetical protein